MNTCSRDLGVSRNPLSFPLVGNPSERFWTSQNDRIKDPVVRPRELHVKIFL
jgi:hypothetical protein